MIQQELKLFVSEMDRRIQQIGAPRVKDKAGFAAYQLKQVEQIVALEAQWKTELLSTPVGQQVYESFVTYAFTLPSILSARSYFRERQTAFVDVLGPALRAGDWKRLAEYRVNFRFIKWAMAHFELGVLEQLTKSILKVRDEMVVLLMPLAISRARIFWGRTPPSHLSLQDLTSLAMEGLLVTVDKFVPPDASPEVQVGQYRSVAIGRSTGNLIQAYSETVLRFAQEEQKVLYRANKEAGKMTRLGGVDFDALAKKLNDEAEGVFEVTPEDLQELMSAASHVSTDALVGVRRTVTKMMTPPDQAPDELASDNEGTQKIRAILPLLSLLQRKLLCLKGFIQVVDVEGEVC